MTYLATVLCLIRDRMSYILFSYLVFYSYEGDLGVAHPAISLPRSASNQCNHCRFSRRSRCPQQHRYLYTYQMTNDTNHLGSVTYQVQSCCNTVVWFIDRASGREHVAIADDETTIAQLKARIDRTVEYAKGVDVAELKNDPITMLDRFYFASAQRYLSEFAIPNFHFHLSTGYCILRTQGVPLDAMDYLSNVFEPIPKA